MNEAISSVKADGIVKNEITKQFALDILSGQEGAEQKWIRKE
jgi:hypothetical protein